MSELKPCPFCGEVPVEFSQSNKDREGTPVAVACSGCGALGPWVYCPEMQDGSLNKAEAISEWNQRQPRPDTKWLDYFEQAGWSISVSAPTLINKRKRANAQRGDRQSNGAGEMSEHFKRWWVHDGGSEKWAAAIEHDTLDALEMVFKAGRNSMETDEYECLCAACGTMVVEMVICEDCESLLML